MSAADINIVQGTTQTQEWECLQADESPFDLTGSTVLLFISWPGGTTIKRSSAVAESGLTHGGADGKISWHYSTEDSRALPVGRVARYEIERRIGSNQGRLLAGYITVEEGANDDA